MSDRESLDIALSAVQEASVLCRRIQSRLVDRDTLIKKDRSPVTIADFASQAVICNLLESRLPGIPVVGEESAGDLEGDRGGRLIEGVQRFLPDWQAGDIRKAVAYGCGKAEGQFFTVDPIDGTKGFLRGDQYAVALALIEDGLLRIGVLGCPNLVDGETGKQGFLFFAINGGGAFYRPLDESQADLPLKVSAASGDGAVRFLESVESGHANHDLQAEVMASVGGHPESVRIDSQAKYARLAQGAADCYLRLPSGRSPDYREKIWDHAAGAIIVSEAGGKVTDIFGHELDFNCGKRLENNRGIIATNGLIHDAVIRGVRSARN